MDSGLFRCSDTSFLLLFDGLTAKKDLGVLEGLIAFDFHDGPRKNQLT